MSSSTTKESKRQRARNERALQELIKGIPGNDTCADCGARNPAWASWSLGVFLCMRCAAIHRKLGTHISKVKSLSMDSWTAEQVEVMRRVGNKASNKQYNPKNKAPPTPIDIDEADSAMERHIREKYASAKDLSEQSSAPAVAKHEYPRRDSRSFEESRPTLPPKSSSKFSFFSSKSKKDREAAAKAHLEREVQERGDDRSGSRRNGHGDDLSPERLEESLVALRDMGFRDEKKNKTVLRGLNGNLQRTVDTLVRLGENSGPSSRSRTPQPVTRASTGNTAGISFDNAFDNVSSNGKPSNNPWDPSSPVRAQVPQSTGGRTSQSQQSHQGTNPFDNLDLPPSNPFGLAPSQSQTNLNQQYQLADQFQNMSVAQSQPLFPNRTGNTHSYQKTHVTPMPSIAQGQYQSYEQPAQQTFNPFFQPQQQQQQQPGFASNPYAQRSATYPLVDPQNNIYNQQQQTNSYQAPQQAQIQPQNSNPFGFSSPASPLAPQSQGSNPFGTVPQQQVASGQSQQPFNPWSNQSPQLQTPQNAAFQQYSQQASQAQQAYNPLLPQQTGRNKNDILALYNTPNSGPLLFNQAQQQNSQNVMQSPIPLENAASNPFFRGNENNNGQLQQGFMPGFPAQQGQQGLGQNQQQQRSVSLPMGGYGNTATNSTNPFMASHPTSASNAMYQAQGQQQQPGQQQGHGHMSHESISHGAGGWGVQNGRHSPDAFASLSARALR